MGVVYAIRNLLNGKCYIGQTKQKLTDRISKHLYAAEKGSDQLIHKAVRKYGVDNFSMEVVMECGSIEELNACEKAMIEHYGSMVPLGYNLKSGGHNVRYSEESRLKMSAAHMGKKLSSEHKRKIGEKCKGLQGPWKGKKMSNEHKNNISKGHKGKKHSDATKLKISKAKLGHNNPMYGKSGSDHHNSKTVTLVCPNGDIDFFGSLTEACKAYDLDIRNLSAVVLGKRRSHKGFKVCW